MGSRGWERRREGPRVLQGEKRKSKVEGWDAGAKGNPERGTEDMIEGKMGPLSPSSEKPAWSNTMLGRQSWVAVGGFCCPSCFLCSAFPRSHPTNVSPALLHSSSCTPMFQSCTSPKGTFLGQCTRVPGPAKPPRSTQRWNRETRGCCWPEPLFTLGPFPYPAKGHYDWTGAGCSGGVRGVGRRLPPAPPVEVLCAQEQVKGRGLWGNSLGLPLRRRAQFRPSGEGRGHIMERGLSRRRPVFSTRALQYSKVTVFTRRYSFRAASPVRQ